MFIEKGKITVVKILIYNVSNVEVLLYDNRSINDMSGELNIVVMSLWSINKFFWKSDCLGYRNSAVHYVSVI